MRTLLASSGHDVVDAESVLEGIRAASEAPPDLVLVDINIPDLVGYEVTLRLRGMPSMAWRSRKVPKALLMPGRISPW